MTLALAVISLSACGNSDSSGSSNETDQIAATIERAYTSADPSSCSELSTVRSNEQLSGYSGQKAVAFCERYAGDSANDATSVEVSNVQIDGDRASADVVLHGTNLDGSTITQQLVKQGGRWKLDVITAIPHFDGAAYRRAFISLGLHNGDITQSQAKCLRNALDAASDSKLIALNTDPKGGTPLFTELFGRCYF
jgi:hypothetical protein